MKSDRNLEIAKRAHEIWEGSGRPDGQAEQHWLKAERELDAGNDNSAALTSATATMPAETGPVAKGKVAKAAPARKAPSSKKAASAGLHKQTARA